VRDVDRRGAQLTQERLELGPHLHAQQRVEVREGLVHEEDVGLRGDCPRDGDALALAARDL
jgi:hypothetical protein